MGWLGSAGTRFAPSSNRQAVDSPGLSTTSPLADYCSPLSVSPAPFDGSVLSRPGVRLSRLAGTPRWPGEDSLAEHKHFLSHGASDVPMCSVGFPAISRREQL